MGIVVGGLYQAGAARGVTIEEEVVESKDEENRGLVVVVPVIVAVVVEGVGIWVGRSGDVTLAAGRNAGEAEVNGMTEGARGELGLTEGAGCPACETCGEDLGLDEGVWDVMPLVIGGEFGAVERGLQSTESIGMLGVLCERGFVNEDGTGGDDGGVLGLLCAKLLKDSGGVEIESEKTRGEALELCRGLV
jgi:hypothetical protein